MTEDNKAYRCTKTDFHKDRNVVITVGLTRFKGSILKPTDDIEKSHILLILRHNGKGMHDIIKDSDVTVHTK